MTPPDYLTNLSHSFAVTQSRDEKESIPFDLLTVSKMNEKKDSRDQYDITDLLAIAERTVTHDILYSYSEDESNDIYDIIEQQTVNPRTEVMVSGEIVGSDLPTVGIEGASVILSGFDNYETITDVNGLFSFPGVLGDQTYSINIIADGYSPYNDGFYLGNTDLDLGVIVINEMAFPPGNILAIPDDNDTYVNLTWNEPEPIISYFFDFENGNQGWTTGAISGDNQWQLGTPSQSQINGAHSGMLAWMTGLSHNYGNNANSWLMSPELDLTNMLTVYFSVYLNIWCPMNYDGMIMEYSIDNGVNWFHVGSDDTELNFYNNNSPHGPIDPPKWSGSTPGINGIWEERTAYIPEIAGESSVYLRFRFGSDAAVNGEGIAVDDVYIGIDLPDLILRDRLPSPPANIMTHRNNNLPRELESYSIYRLLSEDKDDEDNWVELATVTDTTFTDFSWNSVQDGFYFYAVKSLYTNNVISHPAFSNWIDKNMTTEASVNITTNVGDSAEGAIVILNYQDQDPSGESPVYSATATGSYPSVASFSDILQGNYDLEVQLPGFSTYVQTNIIIDNPEFFDIELEELAFAPVNLGSITANNLVSLNWYPPNLTESRQTNSVRSSSQENHLYKRSHTYGDRALVGYNIYRDGVQINSDPIEYTTYNDTTVVNNVTYEYYITAVYTLAESEPSASISVSPGPNQIINIGQDTTNGYYLPINFWYKSSLTQTIYMAEEINVHAVPMQMINRILYYNTFTTDVYDKPIQIWMGTTEENDLVAGWIPSTELMLVYDGLLDFPSGENKIIIELEEEYPYDGTDNLVLMVKRPLDNQYYSSSDRFFYTSTPDFPNRTRYLYSDTENFNPANPPSGTLSDSTPNTGIQVITVDMGSLAGYVYDEEDQPVAEAVVSVEGNNLTAITNSEGFFVFPSMFEGTHTVIVSKFGYYNTVMEGVVVQEYETTHISMNISSLPVVNVTGRIVSSCQPDIGLEGAYLFLEGYSHYETISNNDGTFVLSNVFADRNYNLVVQSDDHPYFVDQVYVLASDLNLGDIIVREFSYPPSEVEAELLETENEVYLEWISPLEYDILHLRYDDGEIYTAIDVPESSADTVVGTVFNTTINLTSVSWYLTGDIAYDTVSLYIYSLNDEGLPDSENLLYYESNVLNIHQHWTNYELPEVITNSNGFFVGLSADGPLGLAGDDGTGSPYPFQPETYYYTLDTSSGTWATLESIGLVYNIFLQVRGYSYYTERFSPISSNKVKNIPTSASFNQRSDRDLLTVESDNTLSFTFSEKNNRDVIGYVIYRLASGDDEETDQWTELATIFGNDTSYIDNNLEALFNGEYRYAVRSVYSSNVLSTPSISNIITYEEIIPSIANLQAEVIEQNVELSWEYADSTRYRPDDDSDKGSDNRTDKSGRELIGFKITRNGTIIVEDLLELHYLDEGLPTGDYEYTVIGLYTNGSTNMLAIEVNIPLQTDLPESYITNLKGNYPNPFNPETKIIYSISSKERVIIDIFNIRGQHIRTVTEEIQNPGEYTVSWDGKDKNGINVSSGIFFYRMKAGYYTSTRKMILMK